ncbi:MAG: AAA family ATPase [Betaproteobacteria bacterium]|nr:AAA family ATPase [Betaproteobacteria bacterium]
MVYLQHFGLREPPFSITPDTSFFFACTSIQEALNTLLVAAANGEGFIKITGEVGTGKTLLCRKFLATLDDTWVSGYLPNPSLKPGTFLLALGDELGVKLDSRLDQHNMLKALNLALLNFARNKKRVVLCLDEAQAMPIETLEALRLLTNLETEKRKLAQVILFGQPELDEKLAANSIRQLRQRITFQHHLGTLTKDETHHYLSHRLRVAGYAGEPIFSAPAVNVIHSASHGIPRLINILANKAMMLAFGEGGRKVTRRQVREAVSDTPAAFSFSQSWLWLGLACLAGIGIGWLLLR